MVNINLSVSPQHPTFRLQGPRGAQVAERTHSGAGGVDRRVEAARQAPAVRHRERAQRNHALVTVGLRALVQIRLPVAGQAVVPERVVLLANREVHGRAHARQSNASGFTTNTLQRSVRGRRVAVVATRVTVTEGPNQNEAVHATAAAKMWVARRRTRLPQARRLLHALLKLNRQSVAVALPLLAVRILLLVSGARLPPAGMPPRVETNRAVATLLRAAELTAGRRRVEVHQPVQVTAAVTPAAIRLREGADGRPRVRAQLAVGRELVLGPRRVVATPTGGPCRGLRRSAAPRTKNIKEPRRQRLQPDRTTMPHHLRPGTERTAQLWCAIPPIPQWHGLLPRRQPPPPSWMPWPPQKYSRQGRPLGAGTRGGRCSVRTARRVPGSDRRAREEIRVMAATQRATCWD